MLRRLVHPALAALLCACASGPPGSGPSAAARLQPVRDSGAQGGVDLLQGDGLLRVFGSVRGLAPNVQYLLQVEDGADCAGGDAAGAAGRTADAAALPRLHADATGIATFSFDVRTLSLDGPAGVSGKRLVVRSPSDDGSDGAVAAAGRGIACGTIRPR